MILEGFLKRDSSFDNDLVGFLAELLLAKKANKNEPDPIKLNLFKNDFLVILCLKFIVIK